MNFSVKVICCEIASRSEDNDIQFRRLPESIPVLQLKENDSLPSFSSGDVIVDAIFGSGLNRPVDGYWGQVVQAMNHSQYIYAIDIPSGVFSFPKATKDAIAAKKTFSFQAIKLSFLFPEFEKQVGDWTVQSIGLLPKFLNEVMTPYHYQEAIDLSPLLHKRSKFSHKGHFGHALLIAGSRGMVGAAVLSSLAALRSGLGLLSIHAPTTAYDILQINVPEAMVSIDSNENLVSSLPDSLKKFQALGIGPGLGTATATRDLLHSCLTDWFGPLVLDADALNIIAQNPKLLQHLPSDTILTPHPGEFDRLFGPHDTHYQRMETLQQQARSIQCTIVLKGAYTIIASPKGDMYFNSSGNPALATGGTGDVLTGIILSLLAQGYPPLTAARLGVFIHGSAADLALNNSSHEAIIARDVIDHLGSAFQQLKLTE
jgi:NAD(P)H-hydrate epimerase